VRYFSRRAVGTAAVAIAAACTSYSARPDDPSQDGGSNASADGSDAADAAVRFSNGDFELGCTDWASNVSILTDDTTAHTGTKSCRVCANDRTSWSIQQLVTTPVAPGSVYSASAFIRAAPDAQAADGVVETLYVVDDDGGLDPNPASTSGTNPGASWQQIAITVTVPAGGGEGIEMSISGDSFGGCFLIDDAELVRVH
jgi:hypothetical protein